jgi:CheY-like chemotaxis protein
VSPSGRLPILELAIEVRHPADFFLISKTSEFTNCLHRLPFVRGRQTTGTGIVLAGTCASDELSRTPRTIQEEATMAHILAIDANPKRRRLLAALVREHVRAQIVMVDSVKAAIASIGEQTPDLIVAPTLISPPDEAELLAHMKGMASAPYVQMITLPALDMLSDRAPAPAPRRDILGSLFNRRPTSLDLKYDRGVVAAQIVDGLARAKQLRIEYAEALACAEAVAAARETALVLARHVDIEAAVQHQAARDERRVALRKAKGDLPWLSAIKLAGGAELQIVNISSTGVLVETGSKLTPGSTTTFHLSGPEMNLVVPARFIRSDVARIDGLGVRYHAAAVFTEELDLDGPQRQRSGSSGPNHDLAALFGSVLDDTQEGAEPAHARFARGVRRIVSARDVQVRQGSAVSAGGRETLYFDIPGDDRSRATLQVTFDRRHDVTEDQFRLLKAAAWITAAVLELEKPATSRAQGAPVALLSDRVA